MRGVDLCENHGAACVSKELCRLLKEDVGQIESLGDSHIERVRGRLAILSMLTVRVVDLGYS